MLRSRATARRDRSGPSAARCRRATILISSVISARTRARIEPAERCAMSRLLHTNESTALDGEHRSVNDGLNREHRSRIGAPHRSVRQADPGGADTRRDPSVALHVIVGAGPVGSATAKVLAERGEQVRVVTRSGGGPEHPAIERVAADATDAQRLTTLTEGAAALYNCASPQYHKWFTDWPPLAAAFLATAERTGAVYASASNLYGYGPGHERIDVTTPLEATHPKLRLRAQMWRDALAAHEAGRIRATEVRGSDYIEANSI